jgi:beta-glucosidase/6-phospho-beta-glucosidase/beta-galactosidase
MDFIGLNYYFHDRMVWYPPFKKNENKRTSDIGWEIYPEGIYHVLKYLATFRKPILITENGLADDQDKQRARSIIDHLNYTHKAMSEGTDVRGYFHWSLIDNFEWEKGYGPKFGLYKVDHDTLWRSPRPSAKVYSEICKSNQVVLDEKYYRNVK